MGHKVHPIGIRLGISKDWNSKWYANKAEFAGYLAADLKVRDMLRKKLAQAGISKILIERPAKTARVTIHTARPGVVIGKRGEDIEAAQGSERDDGRPGAHQRHRSAQAGTGRAARCRVDRPAAGASHHVPPCNEALGRQRDAPGCPGHQVNVGGRLNGAEIARSEWYREGRVPLHTLRADIDYGFAEAKTTYGIIGIKVWIYKGEVFDFSQVGQEKQDDTPSRNDRHDRGDRGDRQRPAREAR